MRASQGPAGSRCGDLRRLAALRAVLAGAADGYLAMTTCWDFVQRRIEAYYGKAYGAIPDAQLARDDR